MAAKARKRSQETGWHRRPAKIPFAPFARLVVMRSDEIFNGKDAMALAKIHPEILIL